MYNKIKKLHIEPSTKCNARCPGCPRNWHGSSYVVPGIVETDISVDHIKKLLNDPVLDELHTILLNGDYGDLIMHNDPLSVVRTIRELRPNVKIKIHTNGAARSKEFWQELAKLNTQVEFGIDGLEDTHHLYRRNTIFSTVIKNAKTFIEAGGHATWMMTVFKHNQHQIKECRKLSNELNFERFVYRYSTRSGGYGNGKLEVVGDDHRIEYVLENTTAEFDEVPIKFDLYSRKGQESVVFRKSVFEEGENAFLNRRLRAERDMHWMDTREHLLTEPLQCRAKQFDEIYITAQGLIYPCCWIGIQRTIENFHHYDEFVEFLGQHKMGIDDISLDNTTLTDLINTGYFNFVEESFNTKRIRKCAESCTLTSGNTIMLKGVWDQLYAKK